MNKFRLSLVFSVVVALGMLAVACAPAAAPAPAPAPAKATSAPAAAAPAAAAPTAAPAAKAQPTAVPAPSWPANGKAITIIVPFGAGGSTDVGARLLAPGMEKALGVPINIENKPGAGSQTGLSDLATAKPDGYTIGFANLPNTNLIYSDPHARRTSAARASFRSACRWSIPPPSASPPVVSTRLSKT